MSERLRRLGPAWPALLGLALLALAQTRFETQRITPLIGLAALLGLGAWAWSVSIGPPAADRLGALDDWEPPVTNLQLGGLAATAGLALGGWFSIRGNAFNAAAVAGWLGAAGLWLAVWWPRGGGRDAPPEPAERRKRLLALALVLAATALGGWLRFHRLSLTPNEMTQDHGWKLLDIQTILDGGRPLFLVNNTGREPGQFYYTAALIRLLGLPRDFMALKIGNCIVGALTIPAIYLFAREAGGRKLGVLAAALYAIGKWPLATTRMGLRYPYATLPAALIFWSLWRYARRGERRDALLVGLWLGLGLYGYIGIRVMPLAIAATMALLLLDPRRRSWQAAGRLAGHGLLIAGTAALLFLPLGRFMVEFPGDFWYRVSTRISDRERSIEREVCRDGAGAASGWCELGVLLENNARALGAFNWRGDMTEVNAVHLDPFLDWVTGALLLAGLPLLAWRLARERSPRWLALTASVPITLLASTLSLAFPIENPSAARTGVAMPLIFALAAAPLAALIDWILPPASAPAPRRRWRTGAAALLTAALLAVSLRENYLRYFRDFDRQYRAFIPNSGEVARAGLAYAPRGVDPSRMFLFDWPHWQETRLVGIHLGDIHWADTHVIHAGEPLPARPARQPLLFMLNNQDEARRQELLRAFPGGELARIDSEIPDKWFYLYYVPAGQ